MTSYLYPYLQESASLDEKLKNNYIMTIQYSLDGLSFVIFDTKEQKFLCLKHYRFSYKDVLNATEQTSMLNALLTELQEKENWNINDFKEVILLIDNNINTSVPAKFYQEENKETYLKLLSRNANNSTGTEILSDILSFDAVNIYTSNDNITNLRLLLGDKIRIYHTSTILIENLIKESSERYPETRAFVNVKNNSYELIVINNSELIFHNYFNFNTKEDFLYFLLFAFEQLKIDNETIPLYFIGFIEEKSPIVELCSRYVRNIRFFSRGQQRFCR